MPIERKGTALLALKRPRLKKPPEVDGAKKSPKAKGGKAKVASASLAAAMVQPFESIANVSQPKGSDWCWAACAVMVGDFLGVSPLPNVQEVVDNTPGNPGFNTPLSAAQIRTMYSSGAVGETPIGCAVMGPATQALLDAALNFPTVVEYAVLWNQGGGHVMLIVGSDPSPQNGQMFYYINDPDPDTRERTVTFLGLQKAFGKGKWNETIGGFHVI